MSKIQMDNAAFLQRQMGEKHTKHTKMNRAEYAINKPLLKEASDKLKESNASQGAS